MELIKTKNNNVIMHNNGGIVNCENIIPITHEFADQIYLRKMIMQKNQIVVGAEHKHEHVWFLLVGKVLIKENGEKIMHKAPCYTISKPGAKRTILALEECIFMNVHKNPDNTKNIKELENQIVNL
tara:strand:- start:1209 stop:1586 length:378 start_codon:yes stop_codon:yes gene_type:complete